MIRLYRHLGCLFFSLCTISALSTQVPMKVKVNIPQFRVSGETAILHCDFNLGNDTLYAVKWYKDHEEFYRFLPKARPQANSFPVEGIHVDVSKSNRRRVILHSITWKTSGVYRCEVSAEAPSFSSAQSEARMEVVFLPQEDPVITGVEPQYQAGDQINLNCTSGKSYPASVLRWYINDKQVQDLRDLIHYSTIEHDNGLISSILGLQFQLSSNHFLEGSMKVRCVASIAPILYQSDRESVVQTPTLSIKDMREALLLVRNSSSRPTVLSIPFLISTFSITHNIMKNILMGSEYF